MIANTYILSSEETIKHKTEFGKCSILNLRKIFGCITFIESHLRYHQSF